MSRSRNRKRRGERRGVASTVLREIRSRTDWNPSCSYGCHQFVPATDHTMRCVNCDAHYVCTDLQWLALTGSRPTVADTPDPHDPDCPCGNKPGTVCTGTRRHEAKEEP